MANERRKPGARDVQPAGATPLVSSAEDLGKADGIAVIGGAGGFAKGAGMRSPLASGAEVLSARTTKEPRGAGAGRGMTAEPHGSRATKEPKTDRPTASRAEGLRREISDIHGLDDSHHLSATHLSYVMYDPAVGSNRKVGLIVVLVLAAGVGAALWLLPHVRFLAWREVKRAERFTLGLLNPQKRRPPHVIRRLPTDEGAGEQRLPDAPPPGPAPRRTCKDLVHAAAGDREPLTVPERIDLADCFLLQDDPVSAETALKPLAQKLVGAKERDLNANGVRNGRTTADAFLTLIATLLREGKSRDAEELLRNRCQEWERTVSCVGKTMLLVEKKLANGAAGLQRLFERGGALDPKTQARLWLAGAQMAQNAGRAATADQRYVLALSSAPREALALRKQIYETQAMDLYHRGEMLKLKAAVAHGLADLKTIDPGAQTKLKLLLSLATATNKSRTVHDLLTREEVTYRARGDIDLIDILGPESLKAGLQDEYLRLVRRTHDYYASKYRTLDSGVARRLATWEIRGVLARRDFEPVLGLIGNYERQLGADALSHHLRGVTYAMMVANERYQLLAAQEFQAALRIKRDWESLYALGVTLVRAGKDQQVAPIIKDLTRLITTPGQKYWADMLTAEWYIAKAKYRNAQEILTLWQTSDPDRFGPRQLQLTLYQKTGKSTEAQQIQQSLDDLARTQRYATSFEGLASPLGIMALAKRPID